MRHFSRKLAIFVLEKIRENVTIWIFEIVLKCLLGKTFGDFSKNVRHNIRSQDNESVEKIQYYSRAL